MGVVVVVIVVALDGDGDGVPDDPQPFKATGTIATKAPVQNGRMLCQPECEIVE